MGDHGATHERGRDSFYVTAPLFRTGSDRKNYIKSFSSFS